VANENNRLMRMLHHIQQGKTNADQFYHSSKITLTELYKAESYIEQLTTSINRLEGLIVIHEKIAKETPGVTKRTKRYSRLINEITTELHYLKATSEAMEDNLIEINKAEALEFRISGRIMMLQKRISNMVKKADSVLSS
jgi:hypothetical protein